MYRTFFDRDADLAGKTAWIDKLSKGVSRRYVLSAFVNSQEFAVICSNYSIVRGSIGLPYAPDRYPSLTMFTYRLYNLCLDRSPDRAGLDYWVSRLISGETTGADMALGFANSGEFTGKNLANNDFVNTMYRVFFNRLPDASGLNYWAGKLQEGYSRRFALSGFVSSQEFGNICTDYGINRGSISVGGADMPFSFAVTDHLSSTSDVKYYQFTLPSAGKLNVNFKHALVDYGDWNIELLNSNKNSLQSFYLGKINTNIDGDSLRLSAGTYYVKVSKYNYYSNANYDLTVKFVTEDSLYEKEWNDTLTTANAINIGTQYTGNMQYSNDVDYYKFTLPSAGKLSLSFKHDLVTSGEWYIQILDSVSNRLYDAYLGETYTDFTSRNLRLPAGSYYIKVSAYEYNNSDYKFTVNYTTEDNLYEKEWNDTLTTANAINIGTQYTGNMQYSNDVDYYKFTLSSNKSVYINFRHDLVSSGEWKIDILSESGGQLQSLYYNSKYTNIYGVEISLAAGTYFVKITPYQYNNIDYKLTVVDSTYELEDNDALATANSIKTGVQYTGNMKDAKDIDYYKFTLTSSKSVSIDFKHDLINTVNSGRWSVVLLDSAGNELQRFYSYETDSDKSGNLISLPAGTYYVKIASWYYINTMDYNLTIN